MTGLQCESPVSECMPLDNRPRDDEAKKKKKKIRGLHQLIQNGQHNCNMSILHNAEFKIEALFCTCMRIAVNPFICACREFKNL